MAVPSNSVWYFKSSAISSAERSAFNKWMNNVSTSKHDKFTFDSGQPDGKFYHLRHNDNDVQINSKGLLHFQQKAGGKNHNQLEMASDGNESWAKPGTDGRLLSDDYFEMGFKVKLAPNVLQDNWVNLAQVFQMSNVPVNPVVALNAVDVKGKQDGWRFVYKAYGDKGNGKDQDKSYTKVASEKIEPNKWYSHTIKFDLDSKDGHMEWYMNGKLMYKASGMLGYGSGANEYALKPSFGLYRGKSDRDAWYDDVYLKFADGSAPSSSSSVLDNDGGSSGSFSSTTSTGGGSASGVKSGTYELSDFNLKNYQVVAKSGPDILKTYGKGNIQFKWAGSDDKVKMQLKYLEENDGRPEVAVRVDGKTVDRWTFDKGKNMETKTITFDVDNGDTIQIDGFANQHAYARLEDYVKIWEA